MWYVEVETVSGADMAVQPKNNEISPMERPRSPVHWGICVMNDMITIGADGRMSALRQVLTERNFARVLPGMSMEEVRRMLGKPMKITTYDLKRETHYDWRYMEGSNRIDSRVFTAVFDTDLRVVRTMSVSDPELERNR